MSLELDLEDSLRRDRLRRQRFVAVLLTAICAFGAWFYYAVFAHWPAPIHTIEGDVVSFGPTWWGWLRITWMGVVIVAVGLANLARSVALTVAIHRPGAIRPGPT